MAQESLAQEKITPNPKLVMNLITLQNTLPQVFADRDTIVSDVWHQSLELKKGEKVLIEKISRHFDGPKRFDIVVFTKNHGTYTKTYIKRIIGLPGESVQIIGNRIFINGVELKENFGKDPMDNAGIAADSVSSTWSIEGFRSYFLR